MARVTGTCHVWYVLMVHDMYVLMVHVMCVRVNGS